RRYATARAHGGDLRRDRGRSDGGDAEEARGRRRDQARRTRRGVHHRARAEDARGGFRPMWPDRDDRSHARRVPRSVRHRGVVSYGRIESYGRIGMSVTIRIPTQLRSLSANAAEVQVEASTVADALKALESAHPGFAV